MIVDPSIIVIVLNWNGRGLLKDCLGTLEKVDYENFNVLVVDNGSTDGSVKYIKLTFPNVEVLELNENIGYAAGNNAGFKHIIKNQPDFVIFINNDTTVAPDFIEYLIKPLQKDNTVGQTVPKIYYSNEPQRIWYAGGKVNLWNGNISHRGIRKIDSTSFDILHRTDYATGCCFAMHFGDFENQGGFDENFPMYAEDVDLSLRIKNSGKSVVFVPDSKIWHKVSASMGGEFSFKKLTRKIMGLSRIYTKHAKITQWLTTIFCSPFLLLANIFKYFRLRFSERN